MITWNTGSILDATEDLILHQVNCQGAMGVGISGQIVKKWPIVYVKYKFHCRDHDPHDLLGTVLFVDIGNGQKIVNVFGQLYYGKHEDVRYTDYKALEEAFKFIDRACAGKTVAIPHKLGCGLGRGKWPVVYELIKECFRNCNVTIYQIDQPKR